MSNQKKELSCYFPVVKVHLTGMWIVVGALITVIYFMFPLLIRVDEKTKNMDKNLSYIVSMINRDLVVSESTMKNRPSDFPDDIKSIKKGKTKMAMSPLNTRDTIYPTLVEVEADD